MSKSCPRERAGGGESTQAKSGGARGAFARCAAVAATFLSVKSVVMAKPGVQAPKAMLTNMGGARLDTAAKAQGAWTCPSVGNFLPS